MPGSPRDQEHHVLAGISIYAVPCVLSEPYEYLILFLRASALLRALQYLVSVHSVSYRAEGYYICDHAESAYMDIEG